MIPRDILLQPSFSLRLVILFRIHTSVEKEAAWFINRCCQDAKVFASLQACNVVRVSVLVYLEVVGERLLQGAGDGSVVEEEGESSGWGQGWLFGVGRCAGFGGDDGVDGVEYVFASLR